MYKYAVHLGLAVAYRTIPEVAQLIKMSIALALLPPGLAWGGYEVMKNHSNKILNSSHFR